MDYDIEALKPPGAFGVREAALECASRDALKQSLLDRPEMVPSTTARSYFVGAHRCRYLYRDFSLAAG